MTIARHFHSLWPSNPQHRAVFVTPTRYNDPAPSQMLMAGLAQIGEPPRVTNVAERAGDAE